MKILLLAFLALPPVSALRAQSLAAFKEHLSAPLASTNSFGAAKVTVTEHGDAERAVQEALQAQADPQIYGYRVCIFFDNGEHARAGADVARALFAENFPATKIYMRYEAPYFKVTVGDCLTSEEAVMLKSRVDGVFPKAFVKNETFTITDLLD